MPGSHPVKLDCRHQRKIAACDVTNRTYLYPMSVLNGKGARSEFTGVTFAGEGQDLDTGTKVVHNAPLPFEQKRRGACKPPEWCGRNTQCLLAA